MCTLALSFRDDSLQLYSSRDELLTRQSSPPFVWNERAPRLFAPRDDAEGGTWIGVNEHHLLVAITNRFGTPRLPDRRSRGHLVLDAFENATMSFAEMQAIDAASYNGFHLLIAGRDGAFCVWSDGDTIGAETFDPGWIVVTEQSYGAADNARATWLRNQVEESADPRELFRIRDTTDPFSRPNILVEELGYGTRSNSFVTIDDGVTYEYLTTDLHDKWNPFSS